MSNAVQERVGELEDALHEVMGIWEASLGDGNSKVAGAQMIRIIRLVSLGRLEDGTTLAEHRANSIRELKHQLIEKDATLETAREMLREWNPTPMADTLKVLEGDLEGTMSDKQREELVEARERLSAVPTLDFDADMSEVQLLRRLVGIQGLRMAEAGMKAREDFMAKTRRRMGSDGGKCPGCGYKLV